MTWTQLPKTPPIAQSRTESVAPVSSGNSERPWVRCSISTPNASAIVALMSTLVVSASTVVGLSTPGQWIINGVCPSGSNWGTIGLPHTSLRPDSPGAAIDRFLTQVVAVIGAHDDGGRLPEIVGVEPVEQFAEMMIDHRELGAVVRTDVARLGFAQCTGGDPADGVRRPDEPVAEPLGLVVHRRPRLRGVERFVWVEFVDEQEPRIVLLARPGRSTPPSRASCVGRGSRPPRGTTCGRRRSGVGRSGRSRSRTGHGGTIRRRRPTGSPATRSRVRRLRSDRGRSATGRPRGPARSPTRRSRCGSSRRRFRRGAGDRWRASCAHRSGAGPQ